MLCETLVWIWQLHYSSKEHQAAVLLLMGSITYNQTMHFRPTELYLIYSYITWNYKFQSMIIDVTHSHGIW